MDRTLRIRCPNLKCRVILNVPTALRGQRVRCATCGEALLVPPTSPGSARERPPLAPAGSENT